MAFYELQSEEERQGIGRRLIAGSGRMSSRGRVGDLPAYAVSLGGGEGLRWWEAVRS
jgi:hypothetical protein